MRWARAETIAIELVEKLEPACEIIKIGGSLRRRRPLVNDIELIVVPKFTKDLLGDNHENRCTVALEALMRDGVLGARIKGGDKYRQYEIPDTEIKLDVFYTSLEGWGITYAIRTGPADFSRFLVSHKGLGGALPVDCRVEVGYGRVIKGRQIDEAGNTLFAGSEFTFPGLEGEAEFFRFIGLKWIEPESRDEFIQQHKRDHDQDARKARK